jgi:hypothetical protein
VPEKSFAIEAGGASRLDVAWRGGYKDVAVSFDGQGVASFDGPKELKEAQRVALPDGSTLEVQVASPFLFPELLLTRDGESVPGSAGDPAVRHAAAWQMLAAVAGLNVVIGLLVEATDAGFLRAIGAGWPSVVAGLVYGGLAWLVRGRSLLALGIAVCLFVLDGVFVLVAATQAGGSPPVGGLVARAFFLIPMLRGFPAIRELARPRRRRTPPRGPGRTAAARTAAPAPAPGAARPTPPAATRPAPVARVLSGDAERQRLHLSERLNAGPAPTVLGRGALSVKGQASVDAAAAALRFLAHKCEIGETGVKVTTREGRVHAVDWSAIGRVVVRQLPPDPPWDAGLLVDLVAYREGRWEPLRLFTTTLVNFAALGGEPSTSRLENLRRLGRHVRERNPGVAMDPETLAFVDATRPPLRFASTTELAQYDSVYGAPPSA